MGIIYKGAPGCNFTPSRQKSDFLKHINRKTWCPCKECNWSVEKAINGQVDGRALRYRVAEPNKSAANPGLFVNASQVCKMSGRQVASFLKLKTTCTYLSNLQLETQKMADEMIINDVSGTWVIPEIAIQLKTWLEKNRWREDPSSGYVYAVTSTCLSAIKIGLWRKSLDALLARYATYYGDDLTLVYATSDDCAQQEETLHSCFKPFHLDRELFSKDCWDDVVNAIWQIRNTGGIRMTPSTATI